MKIFGNNQLAKYIPAAIDKINITVCGIKYAIEEIEGPGQRPTMPHPTPNIEDPTRS